MKRFLLLTVFGLVHVLQAHAQACTEIEIILGDQIAIDQFNLNYPDCHEEINRLIIEGDDITNLQGLATISSCTDLTIKNTPNLHALEGLNSLQQVVYLSIENTGITNFNGLESLDTVGFLMHIYGNDQLKDLTGLGGLIEVVALFISECDSFQSFNGLHALKHIESLILDYNRSLVDMAGFPNLDRLRQIYIAYNENMTDLTGLESITFMELDIQIEHNPKLTSFQGLHFLEEASDIEIIDNSSLVDFSGLESLKNIRGKALIHGNSALINLAGINNLSTIAENFEITGNNALQSLEGLDGLISIGSHFQLDENPQLSDITNLSSLENIGGQLLISNNDQLASLSGLDQITSLGGLEISFNDALEACSVESICNYLMSGGQAVVGGNKIGCANTDQILESCLVGSEEVSASVISIFPNPAHSLVFLPERIADAIVFDVTGRKYPMEIIDGKMDVSVLPSGVYMIRGEIDGTFRVASFVKM